MGEEMEEIITMDHGSGGSKTASLIERLFVPAFSNPALDALSDGAVLPFEDGAKLVCSTDSFVISPRFFPGGDIGELCVYGTVNDVSVSGGEARYLTLGMILEEGLPLCELKTITESIAKAARACGVSVVTGDTKVVEKGRGDGIYINTAGIGILRHSNLSPARIKEGDRVIASGTLGDHGAAVMLARAELGFESKLRSDCAPLHEMCRALWELGDALRVLRDPTRGGAATTLNEFTENSPFSIELEENALPLREDVKSACELLGLDPLYCANEGKLLAVVEKAQAERALKRMKDAPYGENAAIIGSVSTRSPGRVLLHTEAGGVRILSKRSGTQLPRIC